MNIGKDYKIRSVAGEYLVVSQGRVNADMTRVISLNETALRLWNELNGKEFEIEDAAKVLMEVYGIPHEQALQDAQKWIDRLIECKVINASTGL